MFKTEHRQKIFCLSFRLIVSIPRVIENAKDFSSDDRLATLKPRICSMTQNIIIIKQLSWIRYEQTNRLQAKLIIGLVECTVNSERTIAPLQTCPWNSFLLFSILSPKSRTGLVTYRKHSSKINTQVAVLSIIIILSALQHVLLLILHKAITKGNIFSTWKYLMMISHMEQTTCT